MLIENREQGFFSCFNLITCGIKKLTDSGIKDFYIQWNNKLYQDDNDNLFDKYFWQQNLKPTFLFVKYNAFDIQYDPIISKNFKDLKETKLVECLVKNKYFETHLIKNIYSKCFKSLNCLGVHIRKTDHKHHGKILEDEIYIKKIDENLNQYSSIFLATDDKCVAIKLKKRYGSLINLNENICRVSGDVGIHNSKFKNKEKLVIDVLTDAISLSCCDKILITQSNISHYVKMIKPNLEYEYLDNHINYKM